MRWRVSVPKHDEIRTKKKFAFFPTLVKDGKNERWRIWFESYIESKQYYGAVPVNRSGWWTVISRKMVDK